MSLYFSLLPSDLSIELIHHLDSNTLMIFVNTLSNYPDAYVKLFPLDKLDILYRKYIASKLPNDNDKTIIQTITSHLETYAQYKQLFYIPISIDIDSGNVYTILSNNLRLIIRNKWDVALMIFMQDIHELSKDSVDFFKILLDSAYSSAITTNNIDALKFIYNSYDNFRKKIIVEAAEKKKYDIFEYLLTLPEFENEDIQGRAWVISDAAKDSQYDPRIVNIINESVSSDLSHVVSQISLSVMIIDKKPIFKIREILDQLQPEMNMDIDIGIDLMNIALESNNLQVAKLLLNYGVDIDDVTIIRHAIMSGNTNVIRFVIDHGADPSPDIETLLDTLLNYVDNIDELTERFDILFRNLDIHMDNNIIYMDLLAYAPDLLLILLKREPTYTSIDSELLEEANYAIDSLNNARQSKKVTEKRYNRLMNGLQALKTYILSRTPLVESEK